MRNDLLKEGVQMYTKQPKKVSLFNTLEILQRYTDENHRISQKDIVDILRKEYDMVIDRKTVKRNLMELIDLGYEIEYTEKERNIRDKNGDGVEKSTVYTDFYLVRDFTDSELRLIIDSVMVSQHIPDNQRRDLVKKISKLSNDYFKILNTDVNNVNVITAQNKDFFLNLEIIDEAILSGKKVSFSYNEYKIDKKLHIMMEKIIERPSKIITFEGHYYMLCNSDKSRHSIYRIDKITEIKLVEHIDILKNDEYRTQSSQIDTNEYSGIGILYKDNEKVHVKFSIVSEAVEMVIDRFGNDFRLVEEKDGLYVIDVYCNFADAYHWALQYGKYVTVISPSELKNEIRYVTEKLSQSYAIGGQNKLDKALFDFKKSKILDLTGVNLKDLNVLSEVTDPMEVILKMNFIKDFSFLKKYKKLTSLKIISQQVEDFSFLYHLEEIKYLRLKNTGFNDLKYISNCKQIKKLCLLESELENIEILYQLTKLEVLQINYSVAEKIDIQRLKENNPRLQISLWAQTVMI